MSETPASEKPVVTLALLQERADRIAAEPVEHYDADLDAVFRVKPLTYGEVLKVRSLADGDEGKFVQYLVNYGSVEPKIDTIAWGALTRNAPSVTARLAAKISRLSGLNSEALDDAKNG